MLLEAVEDGIDVVTPFDVYVDVSALEEVWMLVLKNLQPDYVFLFELFGELEVHIEQFGSELLLYFSQIMNCVRVEVVNSDFEPARLLDVLP